MDLLDHLLQDNPATPRVTIYDETNGSRLDFSATTLDNWAAKVANMLYEELDLEPGDGTQIRIDLPVSWQTVVIALGAMAAQIPFTLDSDSPADIIFASPDTPADSSAELVAVTTDPFGRGVEESGATLQPGALDFAPTVRFYADQFPAASPRLADLPTSYTADTRLLVTGWQDTASFTAHVLGPLAAGGSVVIVRGLSDAERLDSIAQMEHVTARV